MTGLRVVAAGPGATVQDGGRHGHARFGVTAAGPMDPIAHATANRALGHPPERAAIEVGAGGIELETDAAFDLAVAGGDFAISLDGRPLGAAVALTLAPGERLSIRPGASGAWVSVAVGGTIDLAAVLGSLSTHGRSRLGGLDGRMLRAGDVVPVADAGARIGAPARIEAPWLERDPRPIRVMLGPQDDFFAAEAIEAFLSCEWRVSARSDRMAYGLEGPPLVHARGHDIVSDAVAHGAIQVPGSGLPFVLMADRQPTGGYPKIATVIGADLGRMAQIRPGETLRFSAVTREAAVAARRALAAALVRPIGLSPLVRDRFTAEFLLDCNLISSFGA